MASMRGKVIAITGGASGIGFATAKLLHSRGAFISVADVDPDALEATATFFNNGDSVNIDERLLLARVDVSKRAEVDEWIQATVSRFGRLDGAAFLAGVIGKHHGTKTVQELEDDQWDLILRVNLTGMMYSLRAALKAIENGGSVVCASSVQGTFGFAKHAAYSASKHGVVGLARSAAKEVGDRNIRVNCVAPGSINTPLMEKRNVIVRDESIQPVPINRVGTSEEAGNIIVWLLSDEATYVSGATYAVDGGWAC